MDIVETHIISLENQENNTILMTGRVELGMAKNTRKEERVLIIGELRGRCIKRKETLSQFKRSMSKSNIKRSTIKSQDMKVIDKTMITMKKNPDTMTTLDMIKVDTNKNLDMMTILNKMRSPNTIDTKKIKITLKLISTMKNLTGDLISKRSSNKSKMPTRSQEMTIKKMISSETKNEILKEETRMKSSKKRKK